MVINLSNIPYASGSIGYTMYVNGVPQQFIQTNINDCTSPKLTNTLTMNDQGQIVSDYARLYGMPPQPATRDTFKEAIDRDLDIHSHFNAYPYGDEEPAMTTPRYPINLPYADGTERWYLASYHEREDWYELVLDDKFGHVGAATFKTEAEAYQSLETLPGGASRTKTPPPESGPLYITEPDSVGRTSNYCFYALQAEGKNLAVLRDADGDIRVFDTVRDARHTLTTPPIP